MMKKNKNNAIEMKYKASLVTTFLSSHERWMIDN